MFSINVESLKILKYHIFFKKHQIFLLYQEYKKIFKEDGSSEILKVLGSIINIEQYQK